MDIIYTSLAVNGFAALMQAYALAQQSFQLRKIKPANNHPIIIKNCQSYYLGIDYLVGVILRDRYEVDDFKNGKIMGGWGYSYRCSVSHLSNEYIDSNSGDSDSMFASIVCLEALKSIFKLSDYYDSELMDLEDKFRHYLSIRWDNDRGWCNKGNPGDQNLTISPQHTARLLYHWLKNPTQYHNNIKTAFDGSLLLFPKDFSQTPINTTIAFYAAYASLSSWPGSGDKYKQILEEKCYILEQDIINKYSVNDKGWTLDGSHEKMRQVITLNVLYHLEPFREKLNEKGIWLTKDTVNLMDLAWESCIGKNDLWRSTSSYGFCLMQKENPDFNLSLLGSACLLRKPNRNELETEFLMKTLNYIMKNVTNKTEETIYSWLAATMLSALVDEFSKNP